MIYFTTAPPSLDHPYTRTLEVFDCPRYGITPAVCDAWRKVDIVAKSRDVERQVKRYRNSSSGGAQQIDPREQKAEWDRHEV
jgi:hypothetical protein